jgi:hypothetical protein
MPDLTRLISHLERQAEKLRDESERRQLQSICSGIAIIASVLIGWLCSVYHPSLFSLTAGAILSSLLLIPSSLFIASFIWERMLASWVTSGDVFKRLRYHEYEYYRALDRIKKSPLPDKEKKELYSKIHEEFLLKTEPLKERISRLNDPSQRNLLR